MEIKERIKNLILKEPIPLTDKRDVNWQMIKIFFAVGVFSAICIVLFLPTPKKTQTIFNEKTESGSTMQSAPQDASLSRDTLAQLQASGAGVRGAPRSLDFLSQGSLSVQGQNFGKGQDRSASMILSRGGLDSKTQLSAGCRIHIRLLQNSVVANQSMPIIGLVARDVVQEDSLAIPQGSKLIGDVSFDESTDRAQVNWRSIQFPDAKERQIAAIGIGIDGQFGIEGKVHSEAMRNMLGQGLARFVAAYAEGSMKRGSLGASEGGSENGLKSAVSETAKDRADLWAEDLKKQKKWIELNAGQEIYAVITQAFLFRDPGGTYGR